MYQRRIIKHLKPSRFSYLGGFLLFLITSCTTTYVDKIQYVEIDNTYFIKTVVSDLSKSRGSISSEYVNQNTPTADMLQSSVTKELQRRNLLDLSREKQLTLDIIIRNYDIVGNYSEKINPKNIIISSSLRGFPLINGSTNKSNKMKKAEYIRIYSK